MNKAVSQDGSVTSLAAAEGDPVRLTGLCEPSAGSYPWQITMRPNWIHFLLDYDRVQDKACAEPGAPGLWKKIESNGVAMLAWDVPRWILDDGSADEERDDSDSCRLDEMLMWAGRCLVGESASAWAPPASALVKEAIPAGNLTVRVGGLLRRIAVICSEGRLAVRCVVVHDMDPAIERWRVDVIELLAMDASMRWEMARFSLEESAAGLSLVCEVDLTGGPRSKALLRTAADVVSVAVGAVVETADLVSDPGIDLQSIGDCWLQAQSKPKQKGETR